jgi:uncharacterized repeat protein (TIGR03803 family)
MVTILHTFDGTDGASPAEALVHATDGNFYGTTSGGGIPLCVGGCGTIFKITPGGTLTTLYRFCSQLNCTDGYATEAGLVQDINGNFYGTLYYGGDHAEGTVFKITPSGTLTTLYSLCSQGGNSCTDGAHPQAGVVQATNGKFYGNTGYGGAYGFGTIYRLSVGLGPFVATQPTSGEVGKAVKILGTNLTGATSVTFNGTAATFTVVSKSLITTTVPLGATTGKVKVVTPTRTLNLHGELRRRSTDTTKSREGGEEIT